MSLEKLAKILHVDEVNLMHGPRGVAVHVRIEKSWHSSTIDNDDLGENRLEVIAEHLAHLADAHIHKSVRGADVRKAVVEERRSPGMLSWADVGGFQPWDDGPQRQVMRYDEPVRQQPPPPDLSVEPAVSRAMPSRFHAIVEELKNL